MRLRSASDAIVAFLNTALDRAERRQQVVEIAILPHENALMARAADVGFVRRLDIPDTIRIISVSPADQGPPDEPRRFLLYPGGSVPRIGIEIANKQGRRRMVERLFGEVTERCVRRGSHTAVRAQEKAMRDYLDQRTKNPKPFV